MTKEKLIALVERKRDTDSISEKKKITDELYEFAKNLLKKYGDIVQKVCKITGCGVGEPYDSIYSQFYDNFTICYVGSDKFEIEYEEKCGDYTDCGKIIVPYEWLEDGYEKIFFNELIGYLQNRVQLAINNTYKLLEDHKQKKERLKTLTYESLVISLR